MDGQKAKSIRVWDPLVRIGHWTLVASFFIAYFTDDDFLTVHVWAGYVLGAVVLFRLIWGFIGTRHARFSDFLKSPGTVAAYLRSLRKGPVQHYVGHNPAGGIMIILLLFCLSVTVYTGLEIYAIEENAGPLASLDDPGASGMVIDVLLPAAYASENGSDDDDSSDDDNSSDDEESSHKSADSENHEDAEEFWEELHELFADLTLLLIIVHVTGVLVSSRLHRENLVKAMLTGKKLRQ